MQRDSVRTQGALWPGLHRHCRQECGLWGMEQPLPPTVLLEGIGDALLGPPLLSLVHIHTDHTPTPGRRGTVSGGALG